MVSRFYVINKTLLYEKNYLIWLVMCACLSVRAQYSSYNSFIRKALISYQRNSKGFYERKAEEMLDVVTGVESNYAYDKKAQNLYVLTENSNVVVTLNKDYAKIIKKMVLFLS